MKILIRISCIALVAVFCACSSHKVAYVDDIYSDGEIEKEILSELKQSSAATKGKKAKALLKEAYSWIGTPYKYGGKSKSGSDCSGFTMMTYLNALGVKLPRTAAQQGEFCRAVKRKDLRVGDLVFFRTMGTDKITHVGIYVGDDKMIHASSKRGVIITDLNQRYYVEHYACAGRVCDLK